MSSIYELFTSHHADVEGTFPMDCPDFQKFRDLCKGYGVILTPSYPKGGCCRLFPFKEIRLGKWESDRRQLIVGYHELGHLVGGWPAHDDPYPAYCEGLAWKLGLDLARQAGLQITEEDLAQAAGALNSYFYDPGQGAGGPFMRMLYGPVKSHYKHARSAFELAGLPFTKRTPRPKAHVLGSYYHTSIEVLEVPEVVVVPAEPETPAPDPLARRLSWPSPRPVLAAPKDRETPALDLEYFFDPLERQTLEPLPTPGPRVVRPGEHWPKRPTTTVALDGYEGGDSA